MKEFAKMQNKFYNKLSNFQQSTVDKIRFDADGLKLPRTKILTSVEEKLIGMLSNHILPTPI